MPVRVRSLDLGVARSDAPLNFGLPCYVVVEFPPHGTVPVQIRRGWGQTPVTVRAHRYLGPCAGKIYVSNDLGVGTVTIHYADSPYELPAFTEQRQLDEVRRYASPEYTLLPNTTRKVSGLDFLTEIEWQTAKEISLILLATKGSPVEIEAGLLVGLPITAEQCLIAWAGSGKTLVGIDGGMSGGITDGIRRLPVNMSSSIIADYGIGGMVTVRTPGAICDVLLANGSLVDSATLAFILGVRL